MDKDDKKQQEKVVHEVSMVCFTVVNSDPTTTNLHQDDYPPLLMSLVIMALLWVHFYLAYHGPPQDDDPNAPTPVVVDATTNLTWHQTQCIWALYVLSSLIYHCSCQAEESVWLQTMPEHVANVISLLFLVHSAGAAMAVCSVFAIAFSIAAVFNTCSLKVSVVDGDEEDDGLDTTHHNRTNPRSLVKATVV